MCAFRGNTTWEEGMNTINMSTSGCWGKWREEIREIWPHTSTMGLACSKLPREGNRPTFSWLGHQVDWTGSEWYFFLYVLSAQTVMSSSLPVTRILVLMFTESVQVSKSCCGSSWTTSMRFLPSSLFELNFQKWLLKHPYCHMHLEHSSRIRQTCSSIE